MTQDLSLMFDGILLATDKSADSKNAFYHALRLALATRAHLRMIHVDPPESEAVSGFPKVRDTITRWEGLDHHANEADLHHLGLAIRKIRARGKDPAKEIYSHIEKHKLDLLVMSPRKRTGLASLTQKSVSAQLVRETIGPCLLIPACHPGFVGYDGKVNLSHILFPVDHQPQPDLAFSTAFALGTALGVTQLTGHLLHVNSDPTMPHQPGQNGWLWEEHFRTGDPVSAIVEQAEASQCQLIVMVTQGAVSLADRLLGSVTEKLVKVAPCPILVLHEDTGD